MEEGGEWRKGSWDQGGSSDPVGEAQVLWEKPCEMAGCLIRLQENNHAPPRAVSGVFRLVCSALAPG